MKKRGVVGAILLLTALTGLGLVHGQQVHRFGFETRDPAWIKGTADARFQELIHEITERTAHGGQSSEHIQINCEAGNQVLYYYPTSRAPVSDDLSAKVWVKANRPGLQLMARVVLPKEPDPNNLQQPLTTIIRGDLYQQVGRWWPLEVRRPVKLATQQQQVLRLQLNRDVNFADAYIDRLILNLHAGPGLTEVWIDDLEIGPVIGNNPFKTASRNPTGVQLLTPGDLPRARVRPAIVELNQNQFLVNGKRVLFRGIRHSDTPLKTLRDAGFNTIWFDASAAPALVDEAVNLGFWLVPALPGAAEENDSSASERLRQEMSHFLDKDAVLFWDVGGGLTDEQTETISQTIRQVRSIDGQRPIGADAWDGLKPYSKSLDLLGVHRWPLATGLGLPEYRTWLNQRRRLARTGVFFWTWVQTHLPDWYTTLVYERPAAAGFDEPVGPQPEQIRLLTYTALAAGCRGLGFWSDRFLADSHQGRDRLLELALLNLELRMLEPLLVNAEEPSWIDTSNPEVKAAVFRMDRGVLVLPMWLGKGAQFVPGQSAALNLSMVVPQVPVGTQAWQVTPAEALALRQERVVGGTRITVPEFGVTTAIVFTADNGPNGIVVRFQDQVRQTARIAAQWAHDLAAEELNKVSRVEEQLERAGHRLPDSQALLDDARRRIRTCAEVWNKGEYREAYAEAERAVRPLRILMRAQWEAAVRDLTTPLASPYAVSFYTLPRHWQFMELIRQGQAGANLLPNGDFELSPDRVPDRWQLQEARLDEVEFTARRVTTEPKEGQQCLMLQIAPKNGQAPPEALERTFLAIHSPEVQVQPGTIVRISGWVRIPKPITASPDGALFYDSAGGEPLAVRLGAATGWKQYVLYRRAPASGRIHLTMALTGLGSVYFDDVRIEPLLTSGAATRVAKQ